MIKNWLKTLILIPAVYSCAVAQDPVQIKYADLFTEASARKHLTILASPEFEGRGTGQEGGKKAAQYIADHFKSLGLKAPVDGSYFQPVKLIKKSYQVDQFLVNGKEYQQAKDFFVQGSNSFAGFEAAEIIVIGYGIQDAKHNDLKGLDIKDKVVLLINEGEPLDAQGNSVITGTNKLSEWSTSRFKRMQELVKLQPKMILATGAYVGPMVERFGARMGSGSFALDSPQAEEKKQDAPPVVNIKVELADALLAAKGTSIAALKASPASFAIKTDLKASMGQKAEKFYDPNVLGLLEGTDLKEEILIISGHYDHDGIMADGTIFPGADDNGSGTVGVLELASVFAQAKKDGKGSRRSILFIGLAAEEKGLLGSKYYTENPIFPIAQSVVCLNLDMIGRIDNKHLNGNHNYIHAIGTDKLSSELKQITEKANKDYINMELDYMYDDPKDPMRLYYRSDHYNFAQKGIPSAFFFSGLHPHYHTPEDTVDKIDFPMMVKREKLVFHILWEIANRAERLKVDSNKE